MADTEILHAEHDYIFDWNRLHRVAPLSQKPWGLLDETLRDGLQSPSVTDPSIEQKLRLVHLMESLGIAAADIGLPGAGPRAYADVLAIAEEIRDHRLRLQPMCAARTTVRDIEPVVDIVQKTGVPIEVYAFIGSSPIRLFAENWSVDTLIRNIEESIRFAVKEGLEFCLVTEDTTRSRPDMLDPLFRHAISLGCRRLCLCDTVGHATPDGIFNLFEFVKGLVRGTGEEVFLDWHGHNDRGLAVTNSILAIEYGADRVHGTGLGVGERVGNSALDQILLNLKLLGEWEHDLSHLVEYCTLVSEACGVEIPYNYPLSGKDAFRTATGVHAAAIIKAEKKGDHYLADRVYSGVPAGLFGRHQEIEIGPMSGASNVAYWLEQRDIEPTSQLVQAVLGRAKESNRLLTQEEILAVVRQQHQGATESASTPASPA